ncbi:MAG: AI-2E family transporter [Methylovulum sp.]|jgi:Ca2+-transporting ATPase|nr:AI-2E family transporter [Methylovulum sp.]MCF7999263.1 AI-2E family transporter [Methylovulum sp.]
MNTLLNSSTLRLIIPALFFFGIVLLSLMIMRDFFLILSWSFILAYVVWAPFKVVKKRCHGRATLSAAIMTALIALFIALMLFGLMAMLQNEVKLAYQTLIENFAAQPYRLPDSLKRIPWLGNELQLGLHRLGSDKAELTAEFIDWAKQWLGELTQFFRNMGRNFMKLGFVLVTVFFCFRDGETVIRQFQNGIIRYLGDAQQSYLHVAGDTTRAVVYGIVLAALGQGITAGLGYAVAGVQAPILLGAVTAIFALIPMGAMLIWVSVGLMLIATGELWSGLGLLLWGMLAISTVDNVIRPLVISGTSNVPFLVVMFGIFGGLSAFGLIGLFIGPVILSVMLAIWQTWLKQSEHLR